MTKTLATILLHCQFCEYWVVDQPLVTTVHHMLFTNACENWVCFARREISEPQDESVPYAIRKRMTSFPEPLRIPSKVSLEPHIITMITTTWQALMNTICV